MLEHELWGKPVECDEALLAENERLGLTPGSYVVQPLDVVRRTMAKRMSQSFNEVPHFSLSAKIDIGQLQAAREQMNRDLTGSRISLNDLIVKAVATAISRYPAVNASYNPKGIMLHEHADIAVAVAITGGLITPIVRKAEEKYVAEISAEIKDMAARARRKRLLPTEYSGGTMTVSNLGMYGVTEFTSIINPPQSCILSVGAATEEYRLRDGAPYIASILNVTLTCDHRVIDGAIGGTWLQHLREVIEAPQQWASLQGSAQLD